ncbi:hypothetical protein C6Q15_20340 [Burkholderia multivorans]|uniref:Uncharacterized protein n=1 Tax=Burkholderia multivorans TaxID=87883 RepID=A0A2S9MHR3_9BURK|nr:hypothetical protein C6Q15_20340 [Burkholderia multivorans]
MRHGLPSPWVAGRTDYARWRGFGMPADEKCRNTGHASCVVMSATDTAAGRFERPRGRPARDGPPMEGGRVSRARVDGP